MNETMQTILTRRSTRKFKVQEIPQTDLDQILKAALYAPSGMGKQTWQFTVVKNRKKVQRLAEAAGKILGRENYDGIKIILQMQTGCRIVMIWIRYQRTCPSVRSGPAVTVWS